MSRFEAGFVAAAGAILCWQLMIPPVVGLANNGDFGKVLGHFGAGAPSEHEFLYADTTYRFEPAYRFNMSVYSSELLLIAPAISLNSLLSKDRTLDLRMAGLVHGLLFLGACALFAPLLSELHGAGKWVLAAAVLFFFADVSYIGYLNSFYMDVSSLLFMLLAAVLFLRTILWHRVTDMVLLVAACCLLVTSKSQHAALSIPIGGLLYWQRSKLAAIIVIAAGLACLRYSAPPSYVAKGCFTVVFYQILPHAKDVSRTLLDLGLDPADARHIGQTAYSEGTLMDDPAAAAAFVRRVSYFTLARFFLTHPRDSYVAVHTALSEAGRHRPALGNFDSNSGMPPGAESNAFAQWSNWKRSVFFHRGTRFLLCFMVLVAAFLVALMVSRRTFPPGALAGGITLIVTAALELAICAFGDAIDIPRHFLLFYTHCDLVLVATFYLSIRQWCGREG